MNIEVGEDGIPKYPETIYVKVSDQDLYAHNTIDEHVEIGNDTPVAVYTLKEVVNVSAEIKTSVIRSAK